MKPFKAIGKFLLLLFQGALVGAGAIVPGVSGGVLCVAFGMYEPLMELLTHPLRTLRKSYSLFIPFFAGWIFSFFCLARAMELLFLYAPAVALMLFFGLVLGTLPSLFEKTATRDPHGSWFPFVLSLGLFFLFFHILETLTGITVAPSFGAYLFCGVLWGLSLILPGLNSSPALVLVGLYEPLTAGIGSFSVSVLLPFVLGIAGTVALLAKLVAALFRKHNAATSRVILGFVLASSLLSLPDAFDSTATLFVSLVCMAVGFLLAYAMSYEKKTEKTSL